VKYIKRKTLLYKSGVEYADYGLNHIEGCSHGCTYPCYAFMMKKRCGIIKTYKDWIQPKIVENTLELLDKELPKVYKKINTVFLCFSTDPFMYQQKEVRDLSLAILKKLNQYNVKSTLISKGLYPSILGDKKLFHAQNDYGSTIVSLSEEYRAIYEPGAAPISERIKALKRLHDSGLKTWISMEPYPTPNIFQQDIRRILNGISFVDKIVFGRWNYSKKVSGHKYHKEFYNSMAGYVIEFCKKNNIEIHIKKGTISEDKPPEKIEDNEVALENYILNTTPSTGWLIFNKA